jgi:L-ribulokinase
MTQPAEALVVGVDYGTLSGRAVVVRVRDGQVLGSGVHDYRHGVMERALTVSGGADRAAVSSPLPPDWALQVPADYVDVLRVAVPAALEQARRDHGAEPSQVVGIGTDFTACTMVPTTADGTPLNELREFADRPHAYVKLWKHHAAQPTPTGSTSWRTSAARAWIERYGGLISSEWEFAKGLQLLEEDPEVYAAMRHWVEAADWIVWQLCGTYVRNACTAGYKGILQDGAYPSPEFLAALNPDFADFVADKVEHPIGQLGQAAGGLTAEAAAWTGLPEGIAVAVGNVDAHVTAPAAGAVGAGQMVAIMGTSTCHVMNGDVVREVPGMCGVVDGGITEGLWGYEAGQSGVGDIFGWFVEHRCPASYAQAAARPGISPTST